MTSTRIDTAMALAAGLGTRMRPLTETTPKALLPVAGRTLLDRTLDRLEEVGVRRVIVNAHHHADQLTRHIAARPAPALVVSDETDALLETGGGVKRALPLIDADIFLVVNSDTLWIGPRALAPLTAVWAPDEMDALLLLAPIETVRGYTRAGDFFLESPTAPTGRLRRRGQAASAPYVYTGAQVIAARAFDDAPDGSFSLNAIWDRAIARGRVWGVVHHRGWLDVGTPAGLRVADRAAQAWPRIAARPVSSENGAEDA